MSSIMSKPRTIPTAGTPVTNIVERITMLVPEEMVPMDAASVLSAVKRIVVIPKSMLNNRCPLKICFWF